VNIYACIKQVPDTEAKITLVSETEIDEKNIKWVLNPYCEFAVEEALRLKEKVGESEVIVVSVGPARALESMRSALAMGADRGILVETAPKMFLDAPSVATIIAAALGKEKKVDYLFLGKQAIDDDAYLTHIFLAENLGLPVVTNVIGFSYEDGKTIAKREVEEGALESVECTGPAVIAVTKGLNTPRYPTLPNIMKAKKKEIKVIALGELGLGELTPSYQLVKMVLPPKKKEGRIIPGEIQKSVPELVAALRNEAKAI
jgi:electron transfer flavoprotein beta subunit